MSDHEPQPVTIDAVAMAMIRESEKREREQATKDRIKKLEARVAELERWKAEATIVMNGIDELRQFNLSLGVGLVPAAVEHIKELQARVAELEATLADSVPRDVAEDCAFLGLCCGSISTKNPYWAPEIVRAAALTVNPKNDPGWATSIFTEAVARAESEARK